ncbi:MAG TPA: exo-alpha-sialidase [Opitutaceae bacterium]|nr:exo-alpha-sialidase [Opitutaceae bacterium]
MNLSRTILLTLRLVLLGAFTCAAALSAADSAHAKKSAKTLVSAQANQDSVFLFAYFYHDREAEGLRLAWSEDGYTFHPLNGTRSVLRPTVGEGKLMRDPCLYRGPDGIFRLVWTTGWTGRTIGYASSTDLIHWSEQQAVPVMTHEAQAQNCWAPEIVWDDARKDYLIFWSTTILGRFPQTELSNKRPERNHRIYATTTKDFVTYTPTKLLYDGGFNVIDANLLRDEDGRWLMFVKNETVQPETEKNIRMIRGETAEGPWSEASPALTGAYWAEGPTSIKVGGEYRVYFDKHRLNAIGLVTSRDLKTWTDESDRVTFPKDARHGSILTVPRKVVQQLQAAWPEAVLSSEFINEGAPYPECHASTLVGLAPGQLAAAWFGGTKERNPDVGIWFARLRDGKWETAREVAKGASTSPGQPRVPAWNPVLFQPKRGPLCLFYKLGPSPSKWWGMVITSTDGGETWSAPRRLPNGILGPIKNKPVELADGTWLSPSSTEGNPDGWRVHFERSSDQGATWQRTDDVAKGPNLDAIQPSVLFHANGKLEAVMRTKQGVIAQTWSSDNGLHWSSLTATNLPNPNSGNDAVTLADGRQLLVYNHSGHRATEAKGDRWPLDIALSDDGVTWRRVLTLENEPRVSGYAYPAVIQTSDGLVHITYTWARQHIKHVVIDPAKL